MRITQAVKVLTAALQAEPMSLATMLWGSPGIGKSSITHQLAAEWGIKMLDVRLSQLDPVDLRGIPFVNEGITHWATPYFLPQEKRDGKRGILFLDEINAGAQATQAAAYQLVLDRRLGDYKLPEGWMIVAAGNNEGDRAIVNKMSTALRNRFCHIDVETHPDDFREYGIQKGLAAEVLGFIAFNSKALNMFDNPDERGKKAFATPRGWEFVSRVMSQTKTLTADDELALFTGIVGEGAAAEFMGYLRYHRDLPNIDQLLLNPEKAPIPKEPATLYALTTSLALRATKMTFSPIMKYVNRLPDIEFQVLCVKSSLIKDRECGDTKEFNEWSIKNASAMA